MAVGTGPNLVITTGSNKVVPFSLGHHYAVAGAPVNGVSGSFAGQAGPGALLIDTTNTILYQNTNTKLSPTWSKVGLET